MDRLGCEGPAGWHGEPGEVQQWGARRDDAGHPSAWRCQHRWVLFAVTGPGRSRG
jgi:hypothetical protein